jgi:hypothetical protein
MCLLGAGHQRIATSHDMHREDRKEWARIIRRPELHDADERIDVRLLD